MKSTTYHKINNIRRALALAAAEGVCYDSWTDEQRAKNLRNTAKQIHEQIGKVDPRRLTHEQARRLDFLGWDGKSVCVPLYLLPFLADGVKLQVLNGEDVVVGKDELDDDHRHGGTSYTIRNKDFAVTEEQPETV